MQPDLGIGEALGRVAETFGRLVVQHLQLLRSELEAETRALTIKGRTLAVAIAWATPFILAGVMVGSLALGQLLGLLMEPWLGRLATPLSTLLLGILEAVLAGSLLRMHLRPASATAQPPAPVTRTPDQSPARIHSRASTSLTRTQERAYGAVE